MAGALGIALTEGVALEGTVAEIGIESPAICGAGSVESSLRIELTKDGGGVAGSGCTGTAARSAISGPQAIGKFENEGSLGVVGKVIALLDFSAVVGFPEVTVSTSAPAARRPVKLGFPNVGVVPGVWGMPTDFGCGISN